MKEKKRLLRRDKLMLELCGVIEISMRQLQEIGGLGSLLSVLILCETGMLLSELGKENAKKLAGLIAQYN